MIFKAGDVVEVVHDLKMWQGLCRMGGEIRPMKFTVAAVRPNRNPSRTGAAHLQHLTMTDGTTASGYWFDPDLVGLTHEERRKRLEAEEVVGPALTRKLGETLEWLLGITAVLGLLDDQQYREIEDLVAKSKEAE